MKFGFIAHPMNNGELEMIEKLRIVSRSQRAAEDDLSYRGVLDFLSFKVQHNSHATEGKILYVPMMAQEILYDTDRSERVLLEAVDKLANWGAQLGGLGAYFGIIGNRGVTTNEKAKIRLTTGNILTCLCAVDLALELIARTGVESERLRVAIAGLPGSIARLVAREVAKTGVSCTLVGRRLSQQLTKARDELCNPDRHDVSDDLLATIHRSDIILTATSSGSLIKRSDVPPGKAIVDISAPRDVIDDGRAAPASLVLDGGRCSSGPQLSWLLSGQLRVPFEIENLYGCFAETVLLALEGRNEAFSVGQHLDEQKYAVMRELTRKYGFITTTFSSFGKVVPPADVDAWADEVRHAKQGGRKGTVMSEPRAAVDKAECFADYARHINPYVCRLLELNGIDRVFVRAEGCRVWDSEGQEYLDFLGGYGSLNLGHNHPAIRQELSGFLDACMPNFLQISPQVMAARLARRLAEVTPGDLSRVFFCNSGTEAVEGAIKLCRAATGRSTLVSTINAFHGKTLGSLTVSGRKVYKEPFGKLVPDVLHVPYGDIGALEEAVSSNPVAAFIVEPIQGEGGVVVPPPGYLKAAGEICRKHGTLLIVDEVQTGFGRTGRLFACEGEVVPDVLALAKSLSGGYLPTGAVIARKEVWERAYGSVDRYTLHTSTFGGNNFACVAGLKAIELLADEAFLEEVRSKGEYFKEELTRIAQRFPDVIKEVRGKGLMLGVELHQREESALGEVCNQIGSYFAGSLEKLPFLLPRQVIDKCRKALDDIVADVDAYQKKSFVLQVSSLLLSQFRILSFVTLNNQSVLRIQPPLIVTRQEIDTFLESFRSVIEELRV